MSNSPRWKEAFVCSCNATTTPVAAPDAGPLADVIVGRFVPAEAHGALLVEVPVWDRSLDVQQRSQVLREPSSYKHMQNISLWEA